MLCQATCENMFLFTLGYSLLCLDVSPTNYHYVDLMSKLCSGADICGRQIPAVSKARSCCQDCSCGENCQRDENCCFTASNTSSFKDCVLPFTKQILLSERYKHFFYRMFTRCPVDALESTSNRQDCGDKKVAPWGSLMPVYSETSGTIYKNSECAKCHGVKNFSFWEINLDCRTVTMDFTSEYSLISNLQWLSKINSTKPDFCEVRFTSPLPYTQVRSHGCYRDAIDTCNHTLEAVRTELNMTNSEIENACYLGPRAAADIDGLYPFGNVFCYLCNGGTLDNVALCRRPDPNIEQSYTKSFTTIIDPYTLPDLQHDENKSRQPMACVTGDNPNETHCVPVHCPVGKLYNKKFDCVDPTRYWKNNPYTVTIHLKPLTEMSVTFAQSLNAALTRHDVRLMPWPDIWRLVGFYYKQQSDHAEKVAELVAVVSLMATKTHQKVLKTVSRRVRQQWKLVDGNITVKLKSRFSKYSIRALLTRNFGWVYVPLWLYNAVKERNENLDIVKDYTFHPIFIKPLSYPRQGKITKLHFCPLITLSGNLSYKLAFSETLMLFRNRTFFDNEFEIVQDENGSTRLMICFEDSPYTLLTSSNPGISLSLDIVVLQVVLQFWL